MADYDSLDFVSEGCHIYGEIIRPDGTYKVPRPCIILFHGFPGTCRNDDLAQALRRAGCVVVTPHHRGAWGSEGNYLISHCVEDAVHLAEYARSREFCEKHHTDPEAVFLCGHSIGGNTTLNAARSLPWLRGIILMTPYDSTRYARTGRVEMLRELLEEGSILHSEGKEAMFQDVMEHMEQYSFENVDPVLAAQNICIISGLKDAVAPPEEMIEPLWNRLQAEKTEAVRRLIELPCHHGMCDVRFRVAEEIGTFIQAVL